MKNISFIPGKIVSAQDALRIVRAAKLLGKTIAFTNGCFDILHEGHIYSLTQAAKEADYLIASLRKEKENNKLLNNGPN